MNPPEYYEKKLAELQDNGDDTYCTDCGSKNIEVPDYTTFSGKTGEKQQMTDLQCPKWRWWRREHFKSSITNQRYP